MSEDEATTLTERCRRVLASAGEPLSGREVCDALGEDDQKERNRIYNCLAANAHLGDKGIERLDGKYIATPGWTRKRAEPGKGARTTVHPEPAPKEPAIAATTTEDVASERPPARLPVQPAVSMGAATAPRHRRRTDADRPAVALRTDPGDFIGVERKVLRTLLVVVLEHSYSLTDEQRDAVLQIARQAA